MEWGVSIHPYPNFNSGLALTTLAIKASESNHIPQNTYSSMTDLQMRSVQLPADSEAELQGVKYHNILN